MEGPSEGNSDGSADGMRLIVGMNEGFIEGSILGLPDGSCEMFDLTISAVSRFTAVIISAEPSKLLPVWNVIAFAPRNIPSIWDSVPSVISPAICQKIFSCLAPPVIFILALVAVLRFPVICKIQISV